MVVLHSSALKRGVRLARRALAVAGFAVTAGLAPLSAQPEVAWDFGGQKATAKPSSPVPEGVSGGEFSHHNNQGQIPLLWSSAASAGYAKVSGGHNIAAAVRPGPFDVVSSTYFEVTLAPPPGRSLVLSAISFGSRSTRTGPQTYTVRTSADLFSAPVASGELVNNSQWAGHAPAMTAVSAPGGAPLTVRLYGYGCSGNPAPNSANWRIDDVRLTVELRDPSARVAEQLAKPKFQKIHEIQGDGAASLVVGKWITVRAVVVGAYKGGEGPGGFFLQEEPSDVDQNPATSEGIYVFADGAAEKFPVSRGDLVEVSGYVTEFSGLTEITRVSAIQKVGNAPLPPVASITLPLTAQDDLERYEGMQVSLPQKLFVTENHNLGVHGVFGVSSGAVLSVPTNVAMPGSAAAARAASNALNRLTIDDSSSRRYPDPTPFLLQESDLASATLRLGDRAAAVTGVLSYQYGGWRVQTTAPVALERGNPRPAAPAAPAGDVVRVASANLLNFFNGDGAGGGFPTKRGANSIMELARQRAHIVAAVSALNADIVGLIEVENDGFRPTSAIADIVTALNTAAGAGDTYAVVDLGGTVGSDDITSAIIYKPARVRPVGKAAANDDRVFNRPPIAQTFAGVRGGQFTVCVNHFKSKGSGPAAGADADQRDGQGAWNATRVKQARALAGWLASNPTRAGDGSVLIIGDLNAYAKEDPITALRQAGFENILETFEGEGGYSYAYGGEVGHLDHALASASLKARIVAAFTWHNNSPEPSWLDYNLEDKAPSHQALNDGATPWRASDHDPVVVDLKLENPGS